MPSAALPGLCVFESRPASKQKSWLSFLIKRPHPVKCAASWYDWAPAPHHDDNKNVTGSAGKCESAGADGGRVGSADRKTSCSRTQWLKPICFVGSEDRSSVCLLIPLTRECSPLTAAAQLVIA